jgi:hypothetical protein
MAIGMKGKFKVICNSSPLINLSKIKRLDLLEKIYQQIIIPTAVYDELIIKGASKEGVNELQNLIEKNIINIQKVNNTSFVKALNKDLDYGESEVIALALEVKADLVVIDEKNARMIAEIYDLKKTGFLGVLIKAKREGYIKSVKSYLEQIREKGFWIDKRLYDKILEKLNE